MRRDEAIAFMIDALRECREMFVFTAPPSGYATTVIKRVEIALAVGADAYQPPEANSLEALEEEVFYLRKRVAALEKRYEQR